MAGFVVFGDKFALRFHLYAFGHFGCGVFVDVSLMTLAQQRHVKQIGILAFAVQEAQFPVLADIDFARRGQRHFVAGYGNSAAVLQGHVAVFARVLKVTDDWPGVFALSKVDNDFHRIIQVHRLLDRHDLRGLIRILYRVA